MKRKFNNKLYLLNYYTAEQHYTHNNTLSKNSVQMKINGETTTTKITSTKNNNNNKCNNHH